MDSNNQIDMDSSDWLVELYELSGVGEMKTEVIRMEWYTKYDWINDTQNLSETSRITRLVSLPCIGVRTALKIEGIRHT